MLKRTAIITAVLLALSGCGGKADWTLFYYPRGLTGGAIITSGFNSLAMCQFAGRERATVGQVGVSSERFECGRNCRIKDGLTIATCAETAGPT